MSEKSYITWQCLYANNWTIQGLLFYCSCWCKL